MTLLEIIQETIPTATQEQVSDILQAHSTTETAVLSKPGKLAAFIGLVEKSQPGGMATRSQIISASTSEPAPKVVTTAPIATVNTQPTDRDWAKFDPNELSALTYEDLELYSEWQEKEEKRITLLNRIQGKRATTIASTEESLKNQLTIAETNRRVLQAKAQVEYATNQGAELDDLAVSVGTAAMVDQFDREKKALRDLATVGKETPTLGQVALLQATVIQRNRLNRSNAIANSIAPIVNRIGASTEKEMVTIDA